MGDRVLVLGGGGREHSLAWKLSKSEHVSRVLLAPGNAGTLDCSKMENLPSAIVNPSDNESVVNYCTQNNIDFVVVGPEAPLANGVADCLNEAKVPCFGPSKSASRIESDKAFAKDFMERYGIPTAKWKAFTDAEEAYEHIRNAKYPALVVKASGLAAGKGVIVAQNKEDAMQAVKEILLDKKFGEAGSTIVIEEKLQGDEVSVLAFTDGKTVAPMPPSQDHKPVLDGDLGPNTGGMGAYAPCPLVSSELEEFIAKEILQKAVDGMQSDGCSYVGVLYAGLMLTPSGPKVLEFNCRFGDPETQSILPLLESDLYATMMECVNGELELSLPTWLTDKCAVSVVAASDGYPESYKKGCTIHGLQNVESDSSELLVFHAGTACKETDKGKVTVTYGGRVLAMVGIAPSVDQARMKAYEAMNKICFDGIQYRKDIAARAILMKQLTYSDSGVDIEAGNLFVKSIKPMAAATARSGCSGELGSFGGCFDIKAAGFKDPLLVSGTDGVGTKLKVAQACGRHDTVGIDLVAMCVNDIIAHGAEPLFFLDYFATGKLDPGVAKGVVFGIAEGCSAAGCALLGGETAEMPGMYSGSDYDIAGFAVGAVERDKVLPRKDAINPGDVVVGLGSSGIHSNGFSLVRKIVDMAGLTFDSPCPFPAVEGIQSMKTLGEILLTPTQIYCKAVLPHMREGKIKAFAHITGGGLVDNIPRVLPDNVGVILDATAWTMPPVFGWLFSQGHVRAQEMLKVFNCGIGGALIVEKCDAASIIDSLRHSGEKAWLIGEVVKRSEDQNVVIVNHLQHSLTSTSPTRSLPSRPIPNGTLEGATKKLKLSNGKDGFNTMKVGVLISGSGTNLQALIDQSLRHDSHAQIVLVISNVPGVQGLKRAENVGIPTKVIKHKEFKSRLEFDMAIHAALKEAGVELVCLAGFMRIVTGDFVRKWNGRLLNIHPSLLPSFKGMNAHKLVLEAGVSISGCTVHFVAEEVDAGAIITQEAVPVYPNDTVETLQERVKTAEHRAYPRAMELLASGKLKLGQNNKVQWLS